VNGKIGERGTRNQFCNPAPEFSHKMAKDTKQEPHNCCGKIDNILKALWHPSKRAK
jgi:hypothetical protein